MIKHFMLIGIIFTFFSCSDKKTITEQDFVDSFISNYKSSSQIITAEQDLVFWKKRFDTSAPDLVNKQKYAQALLTRFHLTGDIKDLLKADSLYYSLNDFYKGSEPGILLTLAANKMLRHQFKNAQDYIDSARKIIPENAGAKMTWSDAQFESGNTGTASMILRSTSLTEDYGYNFRQSKLDHYNGSFDSALSHMMKAASLATSSYMKQAALSNAADLYMHEGRMEEAYELYKHCLQLNRSDFHSLLGLGWIALVYDHNNSVADKIFSFVNARHHSPDALWRLIQSHEVSDTDAAKKYGAEFINKVNTPGYGNMYAKYLITLYTGTLPDPAKACDVANKELNNRATPQTYAWLCWSLTCAGELEKAYDVYQKKVSGHPLEPVELFWMGKMMKRTGRKEMANSFFRAALKNKYDLSPAQLQELEANLN